MSLARFITGYILTSLSAFALSGCGGAKTAANANTAAAPTVVDVKTAKATVRSLPTYFEATGNLAGDAQTDVGPTVGGKIVEVNFDIGSYVTKGDVLIRIDPRDAQIRLEQAERQVEQARAQVAQSKTAVAQAEAGVEQARANVRQQQIRLGLTEGSDFDINKFSQVIAVRAQLELAEKELKRAERLLATGDISRAIYDQRLAGRNQLLGQMEEARSNAAVATRAINVAMEAMRVSQAQVNSAKANVKNAEAALNTSLTGVDQARKSLNDTAVYAPISGYVSERSSDLGEFISPNAPNTKVATIVRTAVLRMKIDIPEQNIGTVKIGQGISIQTSAYPDRSFAGRVVRMSPSVNAASRTLTVEAEIENVGGLLKPGQFATVRIAQSAAKPTVMIPAAAVKAVGDQSKVFVIKDGRAEERTVRVGILENDMIAIEQGVAENESVVVDGLNRVFDGVSVNQ